MGLIPAGVLRDTLTVLRASRVSNGAGGWTDTWASVGTVRGAITARPASRDETLEAGAPSGQELVDVVLDDSPVGLRSSDRVRNTDGDFELITLTRQAALVVAVGRKV